MRREPGTVRAFALAALAAAILGAGACGRWTGRAGDKARDREATEAIGALTRAFVEAHNEGDAEGLASLFTDDAVFEPPGEPTCEGRDAIADYFDDLLREAPATAEVDITEITIAGNWAFERIDMTVFETDPETGEELETHARFLSILERGDDGAWRIARMMANIVEPGEEEEEGAHGGAQLVEFAGGRGSVEAWRRRT